MLEREEFVAAVRRNNERGDGTMTGKDARDWMVAQGAKEG